MTTPDAEVHVLEPYRVRRASIHAAPPSPASSVDARRELRLAAVSADASGTTEINLSSLWRQLARGTSRVVDGFFSEDHCYLLVCLKTEAAEAGPTEARRMAILEAVLNAGQQTSVAIDLELAPSTVAMSARLALESFGVSCKPSRAHPILMLAVWAANESMAARARCSTLIGQDDRELRVIAVSRPERCLPAGLPSAERAIIRCLVEGLCHEEIARRRGTSSRTIANQIGAVFRRLQLSGRNELVQRLFFEQSLHLQAAQPIIQTLIAPSATDPSLAAGREAARRSA